MIAKTFSVSEFKTSIRIGAVRYSDLAAQPCVIAKTGLNPNEACNIICSSNSNAKIRQRTAGTLIKRAALRDPDPNAGLLADPLAVKEFECGNNDD